MKIVGMNIEKYIGHSVEGHNCDFDYVNAEFQRHILYGTEENKKFEITLSVEEGECGSGWTTATFGKLNIKEIDSFPGMMFRINNFDKEINKPVVMDYGCFEDINNELFDISFDGGDNYYPSGGYSVNMEYFITNGRGVFSEEDIKRKVWIFKGNSGTGKSFLSNKIDLEKYETDSSQILPNIITQDIVIVGNKFDFKIEDVKERIFNNENTSIIIVNFSE